MPLQVLNRLLASPFQRFVRAERAGGIILIVEVLGAFAWANSPWAASYAALKEASLLHWVNDGLMAIFFLLVGLEIKRELVTGELRNRMIAVLAGLGALRLDRDYFEE
jgi:NhaA family Na+:H+ antiporter